MNIFSAGWTRLSNSEQGTAIDWSRRDFTTHSYVRVHVGKFAYEVPSTSCFFEYQVKENFFANDLARI